MWPRHAPILTPLTKLISTNHKFKWTEVDQNAFEEMTYIVGKDSIFAYQNFLK